MPLISLFPWAPQGLPLGCDQGCGWDAASGAASALVTGVSCQEGSPAIGGTWAEWEVGLGGHPGCLLPAGGGEQRAGCDLQDGQSAPPSLGYSSAKPVLVPKVTWSHPRG